MVLTRCLCASLCLRRHLAEARLIHQDTSSVLYGLIAWSPLPRRVKLASPRKTWYHQAREHGAVG